MLLFDQENQPARRCALGPAGPAGRSRHDLDAIAREIEDTQRQQSETLTHIVERLRAFRSVTPAEPPRRHYMTLEEAGDEPWDNESAEALMQSYEAEAVRPAPQPALRARRDVRQDDWIGARFDDFTHTVTPALKDLKPSRTVSLLEERLDAFQKQMSAALQDVVRREDLEGLRLIEVHVNDLSDKLDELEQHVARIDGIESDVRSVMAQVSDERIAKLLDYDSRFAADIEAAARRAAEEVHSRLAQDDTAADDAESRRHEELRALIEASVTDLREAEAQAVSLVTGLSGRVDAQADRYGELKSLLEQAIQEQRQNEQTAFSMLDTLQQALVTVLDRMDALEQRQQQHLQQATAPQAPAAGASAAQAQEPVLGPPPDASLGEGARLAEQAAGGEQPSYSFRDTRFDSTFGAREALESGAPGEPAAFAEPGSADYVVSDAPDSPLERLRRDFVADARRAKLKAAANRAEELGEQGETAGPATGDAETPAAQAARLPLGGGSGRLFGMSTKLLAGVLALIIAINGGILLFNRKSATLPAAPPAATAPQGEADVGSDGSAVRPDAPADTATPGPRSEGDPEGAPRNQALSPYGLQDDVLDPPELLALGDAAPADMPRGVTIDGADRPLPDVTVAGIYEQQVLASLSGKLGTIAAGHSAAALLPEQGGRVDTAYHAPDIAPGNEGASGTGGNALDLPPATVGPMSLRLAAANGDPSAEFEVAARLAEGKGTGQDYAEALRWYQRSAAKGFAQSQYRLGTLYERGLGVAKDIERAKIWYGRAAENGNVKAMHNLAVLLASGEQGEPDYGAAMPWFLKAAEHGLADSQYNLGVLTENGLGSAADRAGAYAWYALAAKSGDRDAVARRDALKATLDAHELAEAEARIAGFRPRPASPLANDARAAGEDWKKRVQNDTNI